VRSYHGRLYKDIEEWAEEVAARWQKIEERKQRPSKATAKAMTELRKLQS
jgi:hypothetical protein